MLSWIANLSKATHTFQMRDYWSQLIAAASQRNVRKSASQETELEVVSAVASFTLFMTGQTYWITSSFPLSCREVLKNSELLLLPSLNWWKAFLEEFNTLI